MEFIIGAAIIVVICIIGLQGISLHQAQQANDDLERQLRRREGDLAEVRLKNENLRKELAIMPLIYTPPAKPPAVTITEPKRRQEDLRPMVGGSVTWDE